MQTELLNSNFQNFQDLRLSTLSGKLSNKKAIYLDTNFWIKLRQCHSSSNKKAVELLDLLRYLVKANKIFCPLSWSLFEELMKQEDASSRSATAIIMDELSAGVSLPDDQNIIKLQLRSLLALVPGLRVVPGHTWQKVAFLASDWCNQFNTLQTDELKGSFYDYLEGLPLSELIDKIDQSIWAKFNDPNLSHFLNCENAKHVHENTSYVKTYRSEVRGFASLIEPYVREELIRLANLNGVVTNGEVDYSSFARLPGNALAAGSEKAKSILGYMHVSASCYAAVRWDQKRKLSNNDLVDFRHAAAALPYCDGFFTDGPLAALICQKNLQLDELYECTVVSDLSKAIAYLRLL
jgi:hypothetical protein